MFGEQITEETEVLQVKCLLMKLVFKQEPCLDAKREQKAPSQLGIAISD